MGTAPPLVNKCGHRSAAVCLRPCTVACRARAMIAELRHAGLSLRAMTGKLEACGLVARNGRPFQPSVLAKLLRGTSTMEAQP